MAAKVHVFFELSIGKEFALPNVQSSKGERVQKATVTLTEKVSRNARSNVTADDPVHVYYNEDERAWYFWDATTGEHVFTVSKTFFVGEPHELPMTFEAAVSWFLFLPFLVVRPSRSVWFVHSKFAGVKIASSNAEGWQLVFSTASTFEWDGWNGVGPAQRALPNRLCSWTEVERLVRMASEKKNRNSPKGQLTLLDLADKMEKVGGYISAGLHSHEYDPRLHINIKILHEGQYHVYLRLARPDARSESNQSFTLNGCSWFVDDCTVVTDSPARRLTTLTIDVRGEQKVPFRYVSRTASDTSFSSKDDWKKLKPAQWLKALTRLSTFWESNRDVHWDDARDTLGLMRGFASIQKIVHADVSKLEALIDKFARAIKAEGQLGLRFRPNEMSGVLCDPAMVDWVDKIPDFEGLLDDVVPGVVQMLLILKERSKLENRISRAAGSDDGIFQRNGSLTKDVYSVLESLPVHAIFPDRSTPSIVVNTDLSEEDFFNQLKEKDANLSSLIKPLLRVSGKAVLSDFTREGSFVSMGAPLTPTNADPYIPKVVGTLGVFCTLEYIADFSSSNDSEETDETDTSHNTSFDSTREEVDGEDLFPEEGDDRILIPAALTAAHVVQELNYPNFLDFFSAQLPVFRSASAKDMMDASAILFSPFCSHDGCSSSLSPATASFDELHLCADHIKDHKPTAEASRVQWTVNKDVVLSNGHCFSLLTSEHGPISKAEKVYKLGASSGYTEGKVLIPRGRFRQQGQDINGSQDSILVEWDEDCAFAVPGDSGSLYWIRRGSRLFAIGMHIGSGNISVNGVSHKASVGCLLNGLCFEINERSFYVSFESVSREGSPAIFTPSYPSEFDTLRKDLERL